MTNCIVCGNKRYFPVFNPGPQPLSALNLPITAPGARNALRYPMNFVECACCSHVYNTDFNYALIPYGEDSNLMYNSGSGWVLHLQHVISMLMRFRGRWELGNVIDIGCGDGQFFSLLKSKMPQAKCIGFEPGIDASKIDDFWVERDYFIPERDLKRFRPLLLVCRHVLEHMAQPRDFVSEISYWAGEYDLKTMVLFEVPCIDKALRLGRMSDFLYEHVSNFTRSSFRQLFDISGFLPLEIEVCYNDEVLVGTFECDVNRIKYYHNSARHFKDISNLVLKSVAKKLASIPSPIYFWGGTGKSAAFLNVFKIYSPFVVDSDKHKVGRHVPGTGQEIKSVNWLLNQSPGTIVITTPWRAHDIVREIQQCGVPYKQILVLWKDGLYVYDTVAKDL